MAALLSAFFLMSAFTVKLNPPGCSCDNAIASGCVGACGSPGNITYTVQASDVNLPNGLAHLCVSQTGSSLCPNTTAVYTIYRNGRTVYHGTIDTGDCRSFKAAVGDVINVVADLGPGDPNIVCIWLGEAYFSLGHKI